MVLFMVGLHSAADIYTVRASQFDGLEHIRWCESAAKQHSVGVGYTLSQSVVPGLPSPTSLFVAWSVKVEEVSVEIVKKCTVFWQAHSFNCKASKGATVHGRFNPSELHAVETASRDSFMDRSNRLVDEDPNPFYMGRGRIKDVGRLIKRSLAM